MAQRDRTSIRSRLTYDGGVGIARTFFKTAVKYILWALNTSNVNNILENTDKAMEILRKNQEKIWAEKYCNRNEDRIA